VTPPPRCPRCDGALRAPDLWSSEWRCPVHGAVQPYTVAPTPTLAALTAAAEASAVPVWTLAPLLPGWTFAGHGTCGDSRRPAAATATAFCGPAPLGGLAEVLLVAEEPAVGLGAALAGLQGADPGLPSGAPHDRVLAAGHPTPLWRVAAPPDRAAFVGEARGVWLWLLTWPADAALVLAEHLVLADLRDVPPRDLAVGAPSPRLRPGH
jgi:hypothetical protein